MTCRCGHGLDRHADFAGRFCLVNCCRCMAFRRQPPVTEARALVREIELVESRISALDITRAATNDITIDQQIGALIDEHQRLNDQLLLVIRSSAA